MTEHDTDDTGGRSKSDRLSNGESALKGFDAVGRTSHEGGDGGADTPWHNGFRVWPGDGFTKADVARACENHPGNGYILSPSPPDDREDYIYVTVRTV